MKFITSQSLPSISEGFTTEPNTPELRDVLCLKKRVTGSHYEKENKHFESEKRLLCTEGGKFGRSPATYDYQYSDKLLKYQTNKYVVKISLI